jgi:hypothetical protein
LHIFGGSRLAESGSNENAAWRRRDGATLLAGPTGLEPATSGVTGRHSNQLNYDPAWITFNLRQGYCIPRRGGAS